MSWHQRTLFGLDFESTGVDVFNDRIVTATVVKVDGSTGELLAKRDWLINPGIPIPEAAAKVHGITTEHAQAHGQDPGQAVGQIATTVAQVINSASPLVVFNASYDLSLLEVEAGRHSLETLTARCGPASTWSTVIDSFVLAKGFDHIMRRKFTKGFYYTLPDLCGRYDIAHENAHDATADAVAAVLLAVKIAEADVYFQEMAPHEIHMLQKTWRREMQNSLRAYFDKIGKEHDGCDGGWPLHTNLAPAVAR